MVEHAFDDKEMAGYFLPEDSQLLLKQVSGHIRFLARLAQPRIADETEEWAPLVGMAELMFCLDQLAEQLDLVLKEVSWPAQRASEDEASEAPQRPVGGAGTEPEPEVEAETETETDDAAPATEDRVVFGVTMEQIDKLNLLVAGIKAYGDAVFADGRADFADGTLSMLGFTIFDRAVEVDDLLTEINAQHLEEGARLRFSVEETPPAYCVQAPRERGRKPRAAPAIASLSWAGSRPSLDGQSLH